MAVEERQSVAGAYAKINEHEALCAERYEGIHAAIGDLRGTIRGAARVGLGILLALTAWLAKELYDEKFRPPAAVASVSVSAAPVKAP